MINKANKLNKVLVIGARVDKQTFASLEKIAVKENRTISNLLGIWIADRLKKEAKPKKG